VSPETKVATFQVHINPLVSWIWMGVIILIFGAVITMWPEVAVQEARGWAYLRMGGGIASSIIFGIFLALSPARAFGQSSSSLHAGSVEIHDPVERTLFASLLCQCGGCPRLPLTSCICDAANETRSTIRARLRAGVTPEVITADYVTEHGAGALSVPPNRGALRTIYILPGALALGGLGFVFVVVRRWKRRSDADAPPPGKTGAPSGPDEYDAKLDDELKRLDG
jgi:cytochrome c-type biogenesis protein CcmF